MDVFQQIRSSYAQLQERDFFRRGFDRWRDRHEVLAELGDVDDLVEVCGKAGRFDFERRDRVLAALCVEARTDESAKILVCHMMLSALLDVARELSDQTTLPADDLYSEILVNFWEAVRKVEADTPRVAQRLKNAAMFRTLRTLAQMGVVYRREEPTDRELVATTRPTQFPAGDEVDLLIDEAVACKALSLRDAEVLRTSDGELIETFEDLGLSRDAGQKRRVRAKARLQRWIDERTAPEEGR